MNKKRRPQEMVTDELQRFVSKSLAKALGLGGSPKTGDSLDPEREGAASSADNQQGAGVAADNVVLGTDGAPQVAEKMAGDLGEEREDDTDERLRRLLKQG